MRETFQLLVILCLLCSLGPLSAQSTVVISPPELSMNKGRVQVEYDLLNCSTPELFTIRIEIVTQSGSTLTPRSISGDVGPHISCGRNKKILWDIEADNVFLDEEINAQLFALPENPPIAVAPTVEEEKVSDSKPAEETVKHQTESDKPEADTPVSKQEKNYSRTSLILQSVVFPGLGLSKLTGKPHWLKGIAAYGCIAGSVIYNRMAYNSYQDYLEPESPAEADDLFNTAKSQNNISQVLAYAAIGIWVADLVWTIAGTSDMDRKTAETRKGFSIGTSVEPVSNVPLLAVRYRF
ncbi:MAG: hypothetical protein GY790_23430 [Bacteroidetes bacterium]|nr:hypothetical protein [Bacteroidota bacterium]